jgi:hypothetical protein
MIYTDPFGMANRGGPTRRSCALFKTFGLFFRPCVFNGLRFPKDMAEKTANYEQSQRPDTPITHFPRTEHCFWKM